MKYAFQRSCGLQHCNKVAALKVAGCERMYREKASGGRWDRPELHRLLDRLPEADVLVVRKLDRLGEANAGFRSLTEAIDTTTPAGRMMMQMVGAFAEFERAMLRNPELKILNRDIQLSFRGNSIRGGFPDVHRRKISVLPTFHLSYVVPYAERAVLPLRRAPELTRLCFPEVTQAGGNWGHRLA